MPRKFKTSLISNSQIKCPLPLLTAVPSTPLLNYSFISLASLKTKHFIGAFIPLETSKTKKNSSFHFDHLQNYTLPSWLFKLFTFLEIF
ncbi:hypothetical protein O181_060696 [Austropuccinia psidii MF-1]|uniref:Uncharacterized protein n=1 Tax=Austropuccinia psidii MF-1 TaxID=1389203 RepID=A0A9Q3EEM5_9BASI|nr:hypothetical protein [Austropuccinia psidii MF-1]